MLGQWKVGLEKRNEGRRTSPRILGLKLPSGLEQEAKSRFRKKEDDVYNGTYIAT